MNILRRPAVREKTGHSDSTIRRKLEAGDFPKPVILGPNAIGWYEHEIDEYLINLPRGNAEAPVKAIQARKGAFSD